MDDKVGKIAQALYRAFEKLGADFELLSIVGSWRDTMGDEDTLQFIEDYNETGTIFSHGIICSVYDKC